MLVVGGHEQMIGAPVLAATAALRMGAGLVQIAVLRSILPACLSITPELVGLGLGERDTGDALLGAAGKADAIVVGPGMGQSAAAWKRLKALIRLERPAVIDADALNLLAAQERWPKSFRMNAVLTPHPGEMKRLGKLLDRQEVPSDDAGRLDLATKAAAAFGQVVVLKGERTVVAGGGRVYVNHTGDSSLSKAGAGDVLTGVIGALLGQKMEPFDAAATAVWLHGRAGEIAGKKLGRRCVLARDVIDGLSEAIRAYERRPPSR